MAIDNKDNGSVLPDILNDNALSKLASFESMVTFSQVFPRFRCNAIISGAPWTWIDLLLPTYLAWRRSPRNRCGTGHRGEHSSDFDWLSEAVFWSHVKRGVQERYFPLALDRTHFQKVRRCDLGESSKRR